MITTLKELEAFLRVCRKQGVTEISCHGVNVKLGEAPQRRRDADAGAEDSAAAERGPPTFEDLTEEQKMFYSAGGEQ